MMKKRELRGGDEKEEGRWRKCRNKGGEEGGERRGRGARVVVLSGGRRGGSGGAMRPYPGRMACKAVGRLEGRYGHIRGDRRKQRWDSWRVMTITLWITARLRLAFAGAYLPHMLFFLFQNMHVLSVAATTP